MKIAIEAQRIFRPNKHGMDFVALEAVRCLQRIDTENEYCILVRPGEDRCLEQTPNFRIVELSCPSYALWEQWALPRAIRRLRPDVVHCTSNTAPLHCPAPLVLTLHDIIFLEPQQAQNPSLYQRLGRLYRRLVVPRILRSAECIVTVSEFERQRIQQTLALPDRQLVAVHNGYNPRFRTMERREWQPVAERYAGCEGYIFFLGNTDPKKNTAGTLRGYARYVEQSSQPRPLVIADLSGEVIDGILREEGLEAIRPLIRTVGYIPNTDLPAIYNGAFAFLYTSLRESFGIPLLEAMASGTPVISSATSAIPEIAGEGALLVDPLDPERIALSLLSLERDPELYGRQVAYGLQRVQRFSWMQTAQRLLEIYQRVGKRA